MEKIKLDFVNSKLDGIPEIRLRGDIDDYDGSYIARQINRSQDASYNAAKKIRMTINSFGGSIMAAFDIISAMQLFMNAGGVIETINVGVADSAAGWIASNGTRGQRKVMQFASGFFHPPLLEDGTKIEDLPEGNPTRLAMEDTFNKLIDIFVGNTGNTKAKIKSIMSNETDLNAEGLVKNGFADEVVKVNNMPKLKNGLTRIQLFNTTSSIDYQVINKPNEANILNKKAKMKTLALLLNLNPEASEGSVKAEMEKIVNAGKKAASDLVTVNTKLVTVTGERDSYKLKLETIENNAVSTYVDSLIGKDATKKDSREGLINMAKVDFDMFKTMNPVVSKVIDGVNITEGMEEETVKNAKVLAKEFFNLSPAKRAELKDSDYSKFKSMANAYDKYAAEII